MIKYDTQKLDIKKIADSGQTFRMRLNTELSKERGSEVYDCTAIDKICRVGEGKIICKAENEAFWENYFDLDMNYEEVIDSIDPDDKYLCAAAEYGRGIRILRQDPWEMLITFIISQRRSIPSIKTCVEAICQRFGKQTNEDVHAFPSPKELAAASMDDLAGCGLGYRTEYVYLAAKGVCSGEIDLESMQHLTDVRLLEELMSLRGVGPKVANCVSLFGFHRIAAFPIDVWIDRVLKEHYPNGFDFERYEGFAGVLQQYMFYAARQ